MNVNNVVLEAVGVKLEQYPEERLPEIAFAGKSNVGKSSLINGLINRKRLARTSVKPGKTQTINFYNVEDEVYFVDLPGYGYARVSAKERQRWGKMIEDYLYNRKTIKQVILLVDCRHSPSDNDIMMLEWIESFGYEPMIVATKTDKLNRSKFQKSMKELTAKLGVKRSQIFPFSSLSKDGKNEIWEHLDKLIAEPMETEEVEVESEAENTEE